MARKGGVEKRRGAGGDGEETFSLSSFSLLCLNSVSLFPLSVSHTRARAYMRSLSFFLAPSLFFYLTTPNTDLRGGGGKTIYVYIFLIHFIDFKSTPDLGLGEEQVKGEMRKIRSEGAAFEWLIASRPHASLHACEHKVSKCFEEDRRIKRYSVGGVMDSRGRTTNSVCPTGIVSPTRS